MWAGITVRLPGSSTGRGDTPRDRAQSLSGALFMINRCFNPPPARKTTGHSPDSPKSLVLAIHGVTVVVAEKQASDSGKARAGTPVPGPIRGLWLGEAARGCPASAVCRGACTQARLRWPQPGRVPVSCSLAPAPARRAGTSPMAGSRVGVRAAGGAPGSGSGWAAVFVLDHVAGCGQVGYDAVRAALGDVQAARDVARPRPGRGRCTAAPGRGWSGSPISPYR